MEPGQPADIQMLPPPPNRRVGVPPQMNAQVKRKRVSDADVAGDSDGACSAAKRQRVGGPPSAPPMFDLLDDNGNLRDLYDENGRLLQPANGGALDDTSHDTAQPTPRKSSFGTLRDGYYYVHFMILFIYHLILILFSARCGVWRPSDPCDF